MAVTKVKAEVVSTREAGMEAYEKGDYRAALALLLPWARLGDAEAQETVGNILCWGFTEASRVEGDPWTPTTAAEMARVAEGVGWTRKAALQGRRGAIGSLLNPDYLASREERDWVVATVQGWAEGGDADAMFSLGCFLNDEAHRRGEMESREGIGWLRRSGEAGSAVASYLVGRMLANGEFTPLPGETAADWFLLSYQSNRNPAACMALSRLYRAGAGGVERDPDRANEWFRLCKEAEKAGLDPESLN